MPPTAPSTEDLAGLQRLLPALGERLRRLGLCVSVWDPSGGQHVGPECQEEFCRQLCGERQVCLEAMGQAAQRACLSDAAGTGEAPSGCWLLAVPLRRRRRLTGAVVACFPARQTPRSEAFVHACGRARLDAEVMAALARRAARHEAEQAGELCEVLEWVIRDQQAQEVAGQELETLSTNLANTYEELALLYRISGSMRVTQGTREFFQKICQELQEVVHLQAAAAVLNPRQHSGGCEQVVVAGDCPLSDRQLVQLARRHLQPRLADERHPMVANRFDRQARRYGLPVGGVRTLIAVPLTSAETHKGVLLGINKVEGEFDTIDLKLISSISGQAAVYLSNHHLYEDLQDLLMGMLHALTASIDAKDPYTCGHSQRVALISRRLAELSGFDSQRVGRLYLAGLLHDVGKIGMPESVLLKQGRLTKAEYETVKQHPQTGANILSGIRQMEDVLPALLHHHERPDGRGYPDGLRREQIPPQALIVGLADSFDAMTSSRTYRSAMPLEAVVAEVRRCSGTQFDPALVERFLTLDLEAFLAELRQLSTAAPDGKATP
jgi:HD-GYP domain-containing protein (c-di-GMP phosphodiesterase class II)